MAASKPLDGERNNYSRSVTSDYLHAKEGLIVAIMGGEQEGLKIRDGKGFVLLYVERNLA